ncbi:hypothetical protein RHGRI_012838 [Rhododendron griersonianum]|uniref:RRM domain-containing protein n=1 Tax=Rhododendron griersonianum TaxID=479676 RepID=A0AAV6K3L7_9ERIC|nr:hypothetical protein RHGRI_012838 [Rhododendron griersonianum]
MSSIGEADCAASTQRTEVELMESDTMSEPVIELSDEEDEVTAPKSKGRPMSVVWNHFDRVTRKGRVKPDRSKCFTIEKHNDQVHHSDHFECQHGGCDNIFRLVFSVPEYNCTRSKIDSLAYEDFQRYSPSNKHYREYERKSSKSREKDREKGRDKERDRDRDRDRGRDMDKDKDKDKERHRERDRTRDRDRDRTRDRDRDEGRDRDRHRDRDRYSERSERRGRGRDRDDDDHHRSRDYERPKDYEGDREDRHSHRSKSRSSGRSEHRSRSRSKSKRISGFDMAPPTSAILAGAAAAAVAGNVGLLAPLYNRREPTSVALMYKEELMHQFDGSCSSSSGNYCLFWSNPGDPPPSYSWNVSKHVPFANWSGIFPFASQMICHAILDLLVQAMTQQATRHARRVYVGGLPPSANEQSVATFFSHVMSAIGGNTAGPGDAVVNVYINHEKKFAFVEMRSVEEASNAMALDGIIFEGAPVKVRRPSDYNPSLAATLGPSQPNPNLNLGAVGLTPGSAGGLEGPDRIFVGGLPYYFTEVQIRELLESFGPLRGFDLVKDRETGNSKGYAFCVYQDLAVTDIACAALNGIKMGDKTLTVRRANQGTTQPKPEQENVLLHAQQQIALQRLMLQPAALATKVLCLTQVVNVDELKDDEDYEDIIEDMRTECGKFGTLANVVIPRPNPNGEPTPGLGKVSDLEYFKIQLSCFLTVLTIEVFLEYVDVDGATKARQGLNGRKFGGNQVVAVFYPENKFAEADYDG